MSRFTSSALQDPSDLLQKAERELRRLKGSTDRASQSDHAFNCAVTIWHMVDWLMKSEDPQVAAARLNLSVNNLKDLHSLVREESEDLHICYQIATGAKHFELDEVKLYTTRPPVVDHVATTATPTMQLLGPALPLKVILESGERRRVVDVFERAISYWQRLFKQHGLS